MHIRRCAAGMVRVREQEDFNISMALYKETREIPIAQLLAPQVPFMHSQDYGKTMSSRNHEQLVGAQTVHAHIDIQELLIRSPLSWTNRALHHLMAYGNKINHPPSITIVSGSKDRSHHDIEDLDGLPSQCKRERDGPSSRSQMGSPGMIGGESQACRWQHGARSRC